jgi:hypothetical protein
VGFALLFDATVAVCAAEAAPGSEHKYVGAVKCKTCHRKDLMGDQYGEWEKGVHAKAFDTLKSDEAAKIAKEKGLSAPAHESSECLECHVTAYGKPASAFASKPLKASDGVQCESCHGPGNDYKKKKTMADREKSISLGMWDPGKDEKICTACHNDEGPTWDPAEGFDFAKMKEKIAHPIPEDVKGKYIEMEKKLRAEKGGGGDDDEDEE